MTCWLLLSGCEGPLDWITDRVLALHTNTAVFRCVERNADVGLGDYVHRVCREEHSIPVDGNQMLLSVTCDAGGPAIATIQNNSANIIVTGLRLIAEGEPGRAISGDWIPPASFARYPVPARCEDSRVPQVEVAAFRGVRVRLRPVLDAGFGEPPARPAASELPPHPARAATLTPAEREPTEPAPPAPVGQTTEPPDLTTAATADPERDEPTPSAPPEPAPELPAEQPRPPAVPDPRPRVEVASGDLNVSESVGAVYVPVDFTSPVTAPAWLNYRLLPRSATREEDFVGAVDERALIPIGSRAAAIVIPIINDSEPEPTEFFEVVVDFTSTNIVLPEPVELVVRIQDDD